jgi:LemA protein
MTALWTLLGAATAAFLAGIAIYNSLVSLRARVDQAFADIDVQLKMRRDLIPSLVETVKGYAGHEKSTLENVIKARNAAASAAHNNPDQAIAAENMLTGALRQIFALSEAYPNLKADVNFQKLQGELSNVENKLASVRNLFNETVQEYNVGIETFPAVLLAKSLGFLKRASFDVGSEERVNLDKPPEIKF